MLKIDAKDLFLSLRERSVIRRKQIAGGLQQSSRLVFFKHHHYELQLKRWNHDISCFYCEDKTLLILDVTGACLNMLRRVFSVFEALHDIMSCIKNDYDFCAEITKQIL